MRTLVLDPAPAEFEALLERRRRWGADTHDEVWEGVLHMNPAPHGRHSLLQLQAMELLAQAATSAGLTRTVEFNLGDPEDYRVPDGGLHRAQAPALYYPTAALVLEVLSSGDETWEKLPFYASHQVDELLVVDPDMHRVEWFVLTGGGYERADRTAVLDRTVEELAGAIAWPPKDSVSATPSPSRGPRCG